MKVADIIKLGLENQGTTQQEFAENLGYRGQGSISTALSRDKGMGMKVRTLLNWVQELDGKILIAFDGGEEYELDGED